MQSTLLIRKETRIFTKRRSQQNNYRGKLLAISLILGKILFKLTIVLFISTLFIIYSFNSSEARTLKVFTVIGKRNILEQHYSGLIVYIKGDNNYKRSMAPKIISKSGKSIYCNLNRLSAIQYKFLINSGLATFTKNISEAKKRAGNHPYIVRSFDTINSDTAIISNKNALEIIKENQKSKFLNNFKVSFVLDD